MQGKLILDRIQTDLKQAQFTRDEVKVSTLRLLLSEIKNREISLRPGHISDEDVTAIIQREVKKRREAATGFRSGGREESALREELEAKVLEMYLPKQLSNEELTKIVEESINECGANSITDMGKVMSLIMSKIAGKADGGVVSTLVKEKLTH